MTPEQFARMLAGAEVIAGRAQLPFDQLPAEEQERHRLAARKLLDAAAVSSATADRAELRERIRAVALLEAADFLRDAHFRDRLSVQEIGTALRHTADRADPMVGSLARDGFGLDEIAAMLDVPVPPASVDRAAVVAAAPVKQRADCTELEWAEQERARFERLYTRETVRVDLAEQRADTAARDADIYQRRLERLSEGYTEQRHRAEAMERAMESTAADALAHRGCHRDLMAQCLRAERAEAERDSLGREADRLRKDWVEMRTRAERAEADRADVLREAAEYLVRDLYPAVYVDAGQKTARGVNRSAQGLLDLADAAELRRVADETPQPETEATESVIYEVVGDWGVDGADSAEGARAAVAKWLRAYPKCGAYAQQRIVREWPDGSEYYGPWTDLPELPAVEEPKEPRP